ncbi:MAG TPA: response regulator [Desulfobulbus sp.]|nr:response regulator [Desulfobulbus sp.]
MEGNAMIRDAGLRPEQRLQILLVDPDPVNTEHFVASFGDEYEILTTTSGEEALKIFAATPGIAMVLSDQQLGAMSGVELLAEVYARRPETVRIIITGYMDVSDIIDAINKGHIYQYVLKPWDIVQLRLILDQARQTWLLTRENRTLRDRLCSAENRLQRAGEELARSDRRLAALSSKLLNGQEDEKEELATRLSEDLGQALTGLKLQIKLLENEINSGGELSRELINGNLQLLRGFLNEIIDNIRLLSTSLSPVIIDDLGLDAAIAEMVRYVGGQGKMEISFSSTSLDQLFFDQKKKLVYRIAQKALQGFSLQYRPDSLRVDFGARDGAMVLTLRADRVGPPQAAGDGVKPLNHTLVTVSELVNMLGGTLHLDSTAEENSMVVTLPVDLRVPAQAAGRTDNA